MNKINPEKIWLAHYVAGVACGDWMAGHRNRPINISIENGPKVSAREGAQTVCLSCSAAFALTPGYVSKAGKPHVVAEALLATCSTMLSGTAALSNLFGESKMPKSATHIVMSDFNGALALCKAHTREGQASEVLDAIWNATLCTFAFPAVRDTVDELALHVLRAGTLRSEKGSLDKWFRARLHETLWDESMPRGLVRAEVLNAFENLTHRKARRAA